MNFMYGLANGNALRSRLLCIQKLPGCNVSDRKIFENINRPLNETGKLKRSGDSERSMTVRIIQLEQNVLAIIEEDPDNSTRKIENTLIVSLWIVWKILTAIFCIRQLYQTLLHDDFFPHIALYQFMCKH